MHVSIKTKKTAILLITLFLTMYISPFSPRTYAAPTALTVSPNSGFVGSRVNVNGTIDTVNGAYQIFFDSMLVKNGTANNAGRFTDYFTVPHAVNGTHTVMVLDVTATTTDSKNFTVKPAYSIKAINVPTAPNQHQEGAEVEIQANITGGDPSRLYQYNITVSLPSTAGTTYYNTTLPLLTDLNGTASNVLIYPRDFLPAGAHTHYTDSYQIRLYTNATSIGAQDAFIIGITNATTYQRLQWVNIKATNYTKPNENATVTIKLGSINLTSQKIPAVNGTITYDWQVPINASAGTYTVSIATAIPNGTNKIVADIQNFTVPSISAKILTTNLLEEPVGGVNATIYQIDPSNASNKIKVASGLTNSTGWLVKTLQQGGNYTLKAFWKDVLVNETQVVIQKDASWILICQITHIEFTVRDGKTGLPMPFIYLGLSINYSTVKNVSRMEAQAHLTNTTGKWKLLNQLVDANYTIRAYRTELLFNTTVFTIPPNQKFFQMNLTCPFFNLTIHAEDAKHAALGGFPIKIYEYGGGLYDEATTDANSGNVTFSAIFGKYVLRLYNPEQTIVLNETTYSLTTQNSSFILFGAIYNANLSIRVVDYFGQPVTGAKVKFQREGTDPITATTGADGVAFFSSIIGGDGLVSIYLSDGQPVETGPVYAEKNALAIFKIEKYVSIFGLIVEASQFGVIIIIIVILALFALFLLYRRRKTSLAKPTEKPS
ncbi:MAG: hypothetical protein QXM22_05000 [Candidatus Bathyarchaeia archaeon]